jgi:hypothetical protein
VIKEIIAVYSENHTEPINTKYSVKAAGTYNYYSALKVNIQLIMPCVSMMKHEESEIRFSTP